MKIKILVYALAVGLMALCSAYAQHGRPAEPPKRDPSKVSPGSKKVEALKYKELVWSVPEIGKEVQKITLPNGMTLYLYPEHTLPIFNVQAMARTGGVYEPAEKLGIAQLCGTVMRTGGTKP